MLIDWFTVGAQAINFLILVWLMKRFLYGPILNAIDTREKRIASQLSDAKTKKVEAQKEREEFQKKNDDFDKGRAAMLVKVTEEVTAERQRLLDQAQAAADDLTAKRQDAMKDEAAALKKSIGGRVQQEVFGIANKALVDLAGASLEERVVDVFVHRLRDLGGSDKDNLEKALKDSSDPAVIRSAFDLPTLQQQSIQTAVNETFSTAVSIRYETAPNLISGIELTAHGQKVSWSIAEYLAAMEAGVNELLAVQIEPKHAPKRKHNSRAKPTEMPAIPKGGK